MPVIALTASMPLAVDLAAASWIPMIKTSRLRLHPMGESHRKPFSEMHAYERERIPYRNLLDGEALFTRETAATSVVIGTPLLPKNSEPISSLRFIAR